MSLYKDQTNVTLRLDTKIDLTGATYAGIDYREVNNRQISYLVSAGLYRAGHEESSAGYCTYWALSLCPTALAVCTGTVGR